MVLARGREGGSALVAFGSGNGKLEVLGLRSYIQSARTLCCVQCYFSYTLRPQLLPPPLHFLQNFDYLR